MVVVVEVGAICDKRGHIQGRKEAGARTVQMQGCLLTMVWSLQGELIESSFSARALPVTSSLDRGYFSLSLSLVSYICTFLPSLPAYFPSTKDFELLK